MFFVFSPITVHHRHRVWKSVLSKCRVQTDVTLEKEDVSTKQCLSFPRSNKHVRVERRQQQTDSGTRGSRRRELQRLSACADIYTCIVSFLPPHPEALLFLLTARLSTGSEVATPVAPACQAWQRQLYVALLISWPTTHNHPFSLLLSLKAY